MKHYNISENACCKHRLLLIMLVVARVLQLPKPKILIRLKQVKHCSHPYSSSGRRQVSIS